MRAVEGLYELWEQRGEEGGVGGSGLTAGWAESGS